MDIELRTHDPEHGLALLGLRFEEGRESFGCRLRVKSKGFAAEVPFWIERHCIEQFLDGLREMDRTLVGTALLQPFCELDQVSLVITRTGSVLVSGEIGSLDFNYLKFHFTTDQTCLRPLVSDFERLLRQPDILA